MNIHAEIRSLNSHSIPLPYYSSRALLVEFESAPHQVPDSNAFTVKLSKVHISG